MRRLLPVFVLTKRCKDKDKERITDGSVIGAEHSVGVVGPELDHLVVPARREHVGRHVRASAVCRPKACLAIRQIVSCAAYTMATPSVQSTKKLMKYLFRSTIGWGGAKEGLVYHRKGKARMLLLRGKEGDGTTQRTMRTRLRLSPLWTIRRCS